MESTIIWIVTITIALLVFISYFRKDRKSRQADSLRHQEAVRLGADKAVAQHPLIDELRCFGCGACVAACPEGDVLGIVNGKATIINGLKCVGHGKCALACPVEGITVGLGDISSREDLPKLDEHLQTSIPGIYIAGELGGLALIKNAIAQGARAAEAISSGLESSDHPELKDLVIIGAGPAGLSAALTARKNRLSFLLLDQQDAGGTILQYPRKKLVMTKPVDIPLYGTLTKPEYSKEELLDIWNDAQQKFDIPVNTDEKLVNITKYNGFFDILTTTNSFKARSVILALGRRGTPRKLNVPGEHLPKVAYKLLDAESYQDNHILVVGGGDSAIEAAIGLARQSGNTVTLSYRKEKFFRIKSRNEEQIAEYIRDHKIRVLFNSQVSEISDKEIVLQQDGEKTTLANDYMFIFAGGEPPFALLKKIGIKFGNE